VHDPEDDADLVDNAPFVEAVLAHLAGKGGVVVVGQTQAMEGPRPAFRATVEGATHAYLFRRHDGQSLALWEAIPSDPEDVLVFEVPAMAKGDVVLVMASVRHEGPLLEPGRLVHLNVLP
jgi:hypothetical protein